MAQRLISLHPKVAAFFDAGVAVLLLYWFTLQQGYLALVIWFGLRAAWWILLVQVTYYPQYISRLKHYLTLVFSSLGAVGFLIFADANTTWYVSAFIVGIPLFTFWVIPERGEELSMLEKTHRRGKLFLALFGIAGMWVSLFGSIAYQIITDWQIIIGVVVAALVSALVGAWQWAEHGTAWSVDYFILTAVTFLFFSEFGLALLLWPVGYLVSAFFITWVWYSVWLLFRFFLSRDGIDWKKQRMFLVFNSLCMLAFLIFTIRWK